MKLRMVLEKSERDNIESIKGVAYLLRDETSNILFDCGSCEEYINSSYSNLLDLNQVTDIVLGGNLLNKTKGFARLKALHDVLKVGGNPLEQKHLLAHPDVFKPENGEIYSGFNFNKTEEEINKFFKLVLDKNSKYINHNFVYLGEDPTPKQKGDNKNYSEAVSIVYKSPTGIILISGKISSDLEKLVKYAKYVTCSPKIRTFIGCLDLSDKSTEEIENLGKFLQNENIKNIYLFSPLPAEHDGILSKYLKVKEILPNKDYILT